MSRFSQIKPWLNTKVETVKTFAKEEFKNIKSLEKEDLDLNNAGQWPKSIKFIGLVILLVGLVYASHWLLLNSYKEKLEAAKQKQEKFYEEYRLLSYQTANLGAYQQQLVIMQETLAELLAFLPTASNIPPLLDAIQQQADALKLEVAALSLRPEKKEGIYTQIPFILEVKGGYHQLASYIAAISSLSRIVVLNDFSLKPDNKNSKQLQLKIEALTYYRSPAANQGSK